MSEGRELSDARDRQGEVGNILVEKWTTHYAGRVEQYIVVTRTKDKYNIYCYYWSKQDGYGIYGTRLNVDLKEAFIYLIGI